MTPYTITIERTEPETFETALFIDGMLLERENGGWYSVHDRIIRYSVMYGLSKDHDVTVRYGDRMQTLDAYMREVAWRP